MNVFISIIEEAYVSSKTKDKNHWIYSYLKVDPQYIEINTDGNEQLKKIEDINNKINNEKNKPGLSYFNKDHDKVVQEVNTENTIRQMLNTNHEKIFNIENNQNMQNQTKEEEITTRLLNKFTLCEELLDEIDKIIPEVKKLSNNSSIEGFNRLIEENVILIN